MSDVSEHSDHSDRSDHSDHQKTSKAKDAKPKNASHVADAAVTYEINTHHAFFPIKGVPHQMVLVKNPAQLIAKGLNDALNAGIQHELSLGDSKIVQIVQGDAPGVPRKPRQTRKTGSAEKKKRTEKKRTERDDGDGDDDAREDSPNDSKKKITHCKWCKQNGHEATSLGHNSRGCALRKESEGVDVPTKGKKAKAAESDDHEDHEDHLIDVDFDSAAIHVAAAE